MHELGPEQIDPIDEQILMAIGTMLCNSEKPGHLNAPPNFQEIVFLPQMPDICNEHGLTVQEFYKRAAKARLIVAEMKKEVDDFLGTINSDN